MLRKRTLSLLLCVCMVLCLLPVTALAAENVTWSKNTTLTAKVNQYDDAVVGEGVTVTLKYSGDPDEPTGLWITKSLTVKAGGSIGGNGILILEQGASVSGLPLYYKAGGQTKQLKNGAETLWDSGVITNPGDTGTFAYDETAGLWCLTGYIFESDPFERGDGGRDLKPAMDSANRLKLLNLFQGVGTYPDGGTNFDLNRPATRVEALVMLIRLLGKEAEAKVGSWKHPFTDVPGWADSYVGYAYEKGLTNGSSATTFGLGGASAQMYLTFVLRALGYSDKAGGDFTWDKPEELARQAGLLADGGISLDNFLRADAALVSEAALSAHMKSSTLLLRDKLISEGVFTQAQYDNAMAAW